MTKRPPVDRKGRPTIREVAERAGVSVKTVSRVLSGHDSVREQTRARIEAVMAGMEYFPSAAARSLRGRRTGIVSLITDHLTTTPHSFELVKGVQSVCDERGALLMIGKTDDNPETFQRLVAEFRRHRTDAIIKATMHHRRVRIRGTFTTCPLVLVNCFEAENRYPSLVPDDRGGAYAATRFLLMKGHRRIAFLGLSPDMVATQLRGAGYRRALDEAGLAEHTMVRQGTDDGPADEFRSLPQLLSDLLARPKPPTALFCGNDKMAMRTLMLLASMGVHVPRDISVVGFDDYRFISENVVPPLTTMSLPYYAMGARAAKLALDRAAAHRILIPCTLMERRSVAAPAPRASTGGPPDV